MKGFAMCLLVTGIAVRTAVAADAAITNVTDLYRTVYGMRGSPCMFDLNTKVVCVYREDNENSVKLIVEDSAPISIACDRDVIPTIPVPGDDIRIAGQFFVNPVGKLKSEARTLEILRHGDPVAPLPAKIRDVLEGGLDFRLVRLRATVRDVTRSAVNPNWAILGLVDNGSAIAAPILIEKCGFEAVSELLGKEISFDGCAAPDDTSMFHPGRQIHLYGTNTIRIVSDRMSWAPPLDSIGNLRPSAFESLGLHSVSGNVLAIWRRQFALIRAGNGRLVRLTLLRPDPPEIGNGIEAVGFPESNFFSIDLIHATWRRVSVRQSPSETPRNVRLPQFFEGESEFRRPNRRLYGQLVRTRGIVLSASEEKDYRHIFLTDGGTVLQVEAGMLDPDAARLAPGSEIEVCGICVLEVEPWRSIRARFKNVMVVPRTQNDLRVLSRPPWWTPARLLAVIGILVGTIITLLVRHRIQKHTTALLTRLTTDLKVAERTRLAIELHDSLAQNLTGVSCEIDTAEKIADSDPDKMREHLGIAARTLKSCRDELRSCLWDLRNRALEAPDMESAVRQTLAPHIATADVVIRFAVARERISDNTAHAILRIIRELTVNAIRHGHATQIRIAGSVEGDRLMFSVRDNGVGFDPATAPGFAEGHYGLLGIRERIETFEGGFTIESRPGNGAKAIISLRLPQANAS